MKKTILAICCVLAAGMAFARPHFRPGPPPPPRHGPFRPVPPPPRHHHVHHIPGFWPEFAAGVLVGSAVLPRRTVVVSPPPAVVVQPVAQQVWIEGRYIDVVGPNGAIIRQWQPGHYETVTVQTR